MLALLMTLAAHAATLPGVPLPFDDDEAGQWTLGAELPEAFVEAGAAPGWILTAVDDLAVTDIVAVQRAVAAGPARDVRLRFQIPSAKRGKTEETILVVRRDDLVHVDNLGYIPWPDAFAGFAGSWQEDPAGRPIAVDMSKASWVLDPPTGAITGPAPDARAPMALPTAMWNLTPATWVVDQVDEITVGTADEVRPLFSEAVRIRSFQGRSGDHLLVPTAEGLEVYAVDWPRGIPPLPTCTSGVPETCLASGRQILAELSTVPGAVEEASRQLSLACAGGVYRACYEAVAVEDPSVASSAMSCVDGDASACVSVAGARLDADPANPDDVTIGLLEYACEREGAGTLGERLRRIEDVGAGCMMLSTAYDAVGMPDRALLNLDQACVLGRAEACEQAAERRYLAFAARTIRECEDPATPIAASCVELGGLLQEGEVPGATVDDFGAFLRACNLGAADGCLALGDYVDRWGIDNPRVMQAESELTASCESGEQRACMGAAHLLVRHEPRSEAYGTALTLFDQACDAGLSPACVAGAQQRRIGAARKVDEAPTQLDMWSSACGLNSADGCAGLGTRLERSKDTWPDAFAAWTSACDLGDAHACSELGRLVEKKHDPAWTGEQPTTTYLERGCEQGDPEGCFWLAQTRLPKNEQPDEPTYMLLDQSCEGEYGEGCARLANVHLDRKTNFDDEIAARHLDTACENGHFDSCRELGSMYLRGKGVERDRQRANELLDRFRLNAPRKHVRLGLQAGIASVAGGELELVVPIPVGPALAVNGGYSYLPGLGGFMNLLIGEDKPTAAPDLSSLGAGVRLYPNTQARGVYGAAGFHQLTASGGSLQENLVRSGWDARLGFRGDNKGIYTGLEVGLGQYGVIRLNDFDEEETGVIPLILPTFAFSFGIALL